MGEIDHMSQARRAVPLPFVGDPPPGRSALAQRLRQAGEPIAEAETLFRNPTLARAAGATDARLAARATEQTADSGRPPAPPPVSVETPPAAAPEMAARLKWPALFFEVELKS